MDVGAVPQLLLSILKSNGYHHAPLHVCTWGSFHGSPPIWCVQVHLYEKQLRYGCHEIHHIYYATPRTTLNAGIQDAAYQTLSVLRKEIRQELLDKQINERVEKYIWRIEDFEDWDRIQERKIEDLQTLNATQEAIIRDQQGQLERMDLGKGSCRSSSLVKSSQ
jgi:hypothetical protein